MNFTMFRHYCFIVSLFNEKEYEDEDVCKRAIEEMNDQEFDGE